jgi:hypothetical protein
MPTIQALTPEQIAEQNSGSPTPPVAPAKILKQNQTAVYDSNGQLSGYKDNTTGVVTPSDSGGGSIATRYPTSSDSPNATALDPLSTTVDPATIRNQISDQFTSEIAAIQQNYANLISKQNQVNDQNVGATRSTQSAAGTLGTSPIGDTAIAETEQSGVDATGNIISAENTDIANVNEKEQSALTSQENLQNSTAISLIQKKQTDALNDISAIAPNTPLDQLSQSEYDRLYADSGITDPQLFNDYYTAMSGGTLTQAQAESVAKQIELNLANGSQQSSDYADPADQQRIAMIEKKAGIPPGTILKTVQKASSFNTQIDMSTASPITSAPSGPDANTPDPKTGRTAVDVWQDSLDYALSGKNIQAYLGGLSGSGPGAVLKSKIANTSDYLIASAGVDKPTLQAEFAANKAAIATQVDYMNTTQRAVTNAENGGQQILDAFSNSGVDPNDSTYANMMMNEIAKNAGDSFDIRSYQAGLAEVANEYSQVFSRGGQNTVQSHYNANDIVNGNITLNDLNGVLAELQAQGQNVISGSVNQVKNIAGGGGTDAVASFLGVVYGTGGSQAGGGSSQSAVINDPSGNSYDLRRYAPNDPQQPQKVQSIITKMGKLNNPQQMSSYIKNVSPSSPITSDMIQSASQKYGVSWESLIALMQNDSSLGTKGIGSRTSGPGSYNPGNVGNTGTNTNSYGSWQEGVNAAAEWLSKNKAEGGGGSSLPAGTDGASYGFPGYHSDGSQWVQN